MKSFSNAVAALGLVATTGLTGCQSHEEKVALAMQNANRRCDTIGTLVHSYSMRADVRSIINNCNSNAATPACRRTIATSCTPLENDTHLVREATHVFLPGGRGHSPCRIRLLRQTSATEIQEAQAAVQVVDHTCQNSNVIGRLYDYTTAPYLAVDVLLDSRAEGVTSCPNSHILFADPLTNYISTDTSNRFECYLPKGY